MRQLFCVLNSDSVNLNGDRFTVGALVSGTYETCLLGVPSLLGHDHSRPVGWIFPKTIYMEPGLSRAAGFGSLPETDIEIELLNNQFRHHYHKTRIEPNKTQFEQLEQFLIGSFKGGELKAVCECVAYYEPGLATKAFPKLFSLQDKDDLVPLNQLSPIGFGIYRIGELVVFAHQFLRRNMYRLNSLNYPLLSKLEELAANGTDVRVALDRDMVGLAASFQGEMMELQYWWGPKFTDDLTQIPTGVTHHAASDAQKVLSGVSGMQFRWGKDKQHHIFEAEELRDVPTATESDTKYGCRYVHSMVEIGTSKVVHLDGAIRSYSEEKMLRRLEINLDHAPRDTEYTKLWRVDGQIQLSNWKSLISDHYRDNYLVGEYLGGEDEAIQQRESVKEKRNKTLKEEYVPYSMDRGKGVRVALSFMNVIETTETNSLRVIALDTISDQQNSHDYIENCGLELKKALNKQGVSLVIPDEVHYVSFKDLYANFPLVYHEGINIESSLQQTLNAIKKLVEVWISKRLDMIICYKLGFPVDTERAAVISVLGPIDDISEWLTSELYCPPTSPDSLFEWAESVANYLTKTFVNSVDKPPLRDTLMQTGVLLISRRRIVYDKLDIRPSDTSGEYSWMMRFSEEEANKTSELELEGVVPCLGVLIEESRCTNCGSDYRTCDCSKMLDDKVAQEIRSAKPLFFWTDRPLPRRQK